MRIQGFSYFARDLMEATALRDSDLVVDAQNYFYNTYKESNLPNQYGIEGPEFADYLRTRLQHFQQANIRCYFVFKGGHQDIDAKIRRDNAWKLDCGDKEKGIILFVKEAHKQVLDEMNFPYVVSQNESKVDCIALAQRLNCPVLSFDIEFCFSGVPYMPWRDLEYDDKRRAFNCKLFRLKEMMQKYNADEERLALFIVLTDSKIFAENYFIEFYRSVKLYERNPCARIRDLLKWLANVSVEEAQDRICRYISNEDDRVKFLESKKKMKDFINRKENGSLATRYLLDPDSIVIEADDPEWFSKGVILKHVPIRYINLYQWRYLTGSWCVEDETREDALLPAVDIIMYALDLLTDWQNEGFTLACRNSAGVVEERRVTRSAVARPAGLGARGTSVFAGGWARARELRLFEHLVDSALGAGSWARAEGRAGPEPALLAVALAWLARARGRAPSAALAYGVLLSAACPALRVPAAPWSRAAVHPLLEAQHCLQQVCYLRQLCGGGAARARVTWRAARAVACVRTVSAQGAPRAAAAALAAGAPGPHHQRFLDLADAYDDLVEGLPDMPTSSE